MKKQQGGNHMTAEKNENYVYVLGEKKSGAGEIPVVPKELLDKVKRVAEKYGFTAGNTEK